MAEEKGKIFILIGILSLIVLIPLLRAKPPEEILEITGVRILKA